MSEPIQSIAQNNYILQAPISSATMFTTELEYDANNKISGYAGSAFAGQGGGGNPEIESYVQTNSATIDDVNTNVTTNSGAWGGSALPISAGPGIDVQLANDMLVFSAIPNETVLWSSTASTGTKVNNTAVLSESYSNFDRIRFEWQNWNTSPSININEFRTDYTLFNLQGGWAGYFDRITIFQMFLSADNSKTNINLMSANFWQAQNGQAGTISNAMNYTTLHKIVGINRK